MCWHYKRVKSALSAPADFLPSQVLPPVTASIWSGHAVHVVMRAYIGIQ